jgi:hypothetical protein
MYMYCTCIRHARGVYPVMMRRGTAAVVKKLSRAAGRKIHENRPMMHENKRARDLGGALYECYVQLFLGFLLGRVEIAEFEFTDCIRYRYT